MLTDVTELSKKRRRSINREMEDWVWISGLCISICRYDSYTVVWEGGVDRLNVTNEEIPQVKIDITKAEQARQQNWHCGSITLLGATIANGAAVLNLTQWALLCHSRRPKEQHGWCTLLLLVQESIKLLGLRNVTKPFQTLASRVKFSSWWFPEFNRQMMQGWLDWHME